MYFAEQHKYKSPFEGGDFCFQRYGAPLLCQVHLKDDS